MPSAQRRRPRPRVGASASGRHRPRRATRAAPAGSTRPRPGSRGPNRGAAWPSGSAGRAPLFCRYAGSGLVIHRLARFQPIPIRTNAWRIDSPLISLSVIPCAKATRAANASVQSEVGAPKSRGLRCSRARSRSHAMSSNSGRADTGRCEPSRRQSMPAAWKAWIALRTVCAEQPRPSAICEGSRPSALAFRICARRRVNASGDRRPTRMACRSGSLRGRTKVGGFIRPMMR